MGTVNLKTGAFDINLGVFKGQYVVNSSNANEFAALEDQTVEGYAKQKCPKFEVYVDKKGEYRFRLKAINGQIIAVSEGYVKISSCMNGIDSVRKNAVDAPVEEEEE